MVSTQQLVDEAVSMSRTGRRGPKRTPQIEGLSTLLERARRLTGDPSAPKQHHLVPALYLRRWAVDGRIRVTDLDTRDDYVSAARDAARRSGYYSLASADLDPDVLPPLLAEVALAEIESATAPLLDRLADEPESLGPEEVAMIAAFLGHQFVRGASVREGIRESHREMFRMQYGTLSDAGVRRELQGRLGRPATETEVAESVAFLTDVHNGTAWSEPQQPALVGMALDLAWHMGHLLTFRPWVVYDTPPVLVTCDEPVLPIDGPGGHRSRRGGVGTAGVVIWPIQPDRLLVMPRADLRFAHDVRPTHRSVAAFRCMDPLSRSDVTQINRELAAAAHRWAFEQTSTRQAKLIRVPRRPSNFHHQEVDALVRGEPQRVLMMNTPNRWAGTSDAPPWPVSAWWPPGALSPHEFGRRHPELVPDAM